MTQNSDSPDRSHYPSRVLLNAGFGLIGASVLVLALNLFGAKGLLSAPLVASFWLGGSALALIAVGWLWRSRVRT